MSFCRKFLSLTFAWLATAGLLEAAAPARADTPEPVAQVAQVQKDHPHTIYLELLGKGGLWGLGYDYAQGRFAVGAAASFYGMDGERIFTFSPYVAAYPFGGERHRFFLHAGPEVVHVATISPVPEWPGTETTGVGGEVAAGYEYRRRVVLRAYVMGAYGKGGLFPWAGLSLGWRL